MKHSFFDPFQDHLTTKSLYLAKGDRLFFQGETVSKMFLIQSGRIKLIRNTSAGTPVVLHVGNKGEAIAEASLFSDRYHCSAIADTQCNILFVDKNELLHYLQNNPHDMMALLGIFARQVRDLRTLNEIKNIHTAAERTLVFIRANMNVNNELILDLSLKDLANKIGLAHETFYRTLKKLEAAGDIKKTDNAIQLLE